MGVFLLILAFACIALVIIPGLVRKQRRDELAAVLALLFIGFTLSLLQTIGVKVPNPNKGIEFLIKLAFQ